ncbi:MAG: hypothetical protein IPM50_12755 [Acidobacteriota bacterium]|nr:MAG: hypothetical protein IPM50_12755 [Acidobacteriota bacterium]
MKRLSYFGSIALLIGFFVMTGSVETLAQKPALKRKPAVKRPAATKPAEPLYAVESGTIFRVRMNKTISSKTAKVGETFTVTFTEPVYSTNGVVVVPTGSTLLAKIESVKPAAKGGKVGEIDARFVELRLPNGRKRAINASLTDLDAGKTSSDDEGGATGDKMKNRKVIFIGGGAAGGAILGAIVGGGKATAIGAIAGAGAGILGERLMKGAEAEVKSGTEFGVYLNQSISLPRFAEATTP